VATFLAESAKDPRIVGFVTVTGVEITNDLRHAKVFVSVMGSESEKEATFQGLASTASHLRSRVGRALRLRVAPEFQFKEDDRSRARRESSRFSRESRPRHRLATPLMILRRLDLAKSPTTERARVIGIRGPAAGRQTCRSNVP
jgi:ribosome-binding factor A